MKIAATRKAKMMIVSGLLFLLAAILIHATTPQKLGHSSGEIAVTAYGQELSLQQIVDALLLNTTQLKIAIASTTLPSISNPVFNFEVFADVEGEQESCFLRLDGKDYRSPIYKGVQETHCINDLLFNNPTKYANPPNWNRFMARIKTMNNVHCLNGFWYPVHGSDWTKVSWSMRRAVAQYNCTELVIPS